MLSGLSAGQAGNAWIIRVAKEYGFELRFEDLKNHAGGYLRAYTQNGKEMREIVLNKRDKPYRQNFSGALEIARYQLNQHMQDAFTVGDNNAAYTLAADLMLDAAQIRPHMSLSLQEIRECVPWCSHEVVARKLLLLKEAVLTIWDRWNLNVRVGSPGFAFPKAPQSFEIETAALCRTAQENLTRTDKIPVSGGSPQGQRVECTAYYIAEENNPIDRVIMFTEAA